MSRAVCPECEQGKCPNCTGEAMQGETLVDCGCLGRTHLSGMEQEVYLMIEGLAHLGATVPEIRRAKGIKRPAVPLGVLLDRGHVLPRGDARDGWRVYVVPREDSGPQIDAQSVGDKQEGTDMDDETDGPVTKVGDNEHLWAELPDADGVVDYRGISVHVPNRPPVQIRFDDEETVAVVDTGVAKVMQPRLSALAGAKAILGDEQRSGGALAAPSKTRPAVDDLLRLAVYIDKGIVLSDALARKYGTADD